jgi:hypothetical protein
MDWPGWNSFESVSRVHRFFEISGIVCLGLLVLTEIFAYLYGHRKDDLAQTLQTETSRELNSIRDRDAPWTLSEDQRERIISFLKATGKTFTFPAWHSPTDLRSKDFFEQLSDAILKGGWNITPPPFRFLTQDAAGVFIAVKDKAKPAPEGAVLLQNALSAAGVTSSGMSDPSLAEDAFQLYIGQKPGTSTGNPDNKQ